MKKLSIIFIVLALCSCRDLMTKHQNYLDVQNKGKFTVDHNSPQFKVGESGAQFDSPIPFVPLKEVDVTISYYPIEDAACLEYRTDTYNFFQFWSRESREAFVKALETYNNDFEAQKLTRNNSGKTRKLYGTVNGYLIWQMSRFTIRASGHIEMELGYYFKERAPFFTVTQGNAYFENNTVREERKDMNSGERPMYLTKAQAASIAECFNEDYLQSVVPASLRNSTSQRSSTPAAYDEY